jgi:hypothetical protein
MKRRQEIMRFRYSAVFQSVEIRFYQEQFEENISVYCEADVKLPLINKSYLVSTTFLNSYDNWLVHNPVREISTPQKSIEKNENNCQAMDPVGLFILLEKEDFAKKEVDLLVGARVLRFNVNVAGNKVVVQRQDKEQKLVLHKSQGRIEKIEVPVPVLGNLSIKRV